MPRHSRTDLVQQAEAKDAAGSTLVGLEPDTEETGLPDLEGVSGIIKQLDSESAVTLAIQELQHLIDELKTSPPLEVGDRLVYHEHNGPMPAFVQHIYKDGNIRLQIMGQMGMRSVDGVLEGNEIGCWSRRKNGV